MSNSNHPLGPAATCPPRTVARVVEFVAQGVRSTRGLQESLGMEARAVQHALQAAEWLGFIEADTEVALTAIGLEYVYGGRERARVYSRAIAAHPFVADLLRGRTATPSVADVETALAHQEPELAPEEIIERAKALFALITPAFRGRGIAGPEVQLELPLVARDLDPTAARLGVTAGRDYNPDVYRYVLSCLLDHGEIGPGHLRALLDRAGVSDAPIGGYIDLAIARGDAVRIDERLVATPAAVERRGLVDTTSSVILSDPGYRAYLVDLRAAASGDRQAEIRVERGRTRYRAWDRRLFGKEVRLEELEAQLARVVLDRSLDAFPLAKGPGAPPPAMKGSFLDRWQEPGLPVALPPTLASLRTGLSAVNDALRQARLVAHEVNAPDISVRPLFFHGGILAPGEALPRNIPDLRSLRARLLRHCPYAAVAVALLVLHRATPDRVEIVQRRGSFVVRLDHRPVGDLLETVDNLGRHLGWLVSRRRQGGLPTSLFVRALESAGVVTLVGTHAVLAERFFLQLRADADERELFQLLRPLVEATAAWIEQLEPELPETITA
jgi:hypothetical protein